MGYTEEERKKRKIEDREDKNKGAGTKARSKRKPKRGRKSIEGGKIRTESEWMTTEVKTGLHVVYRSSHQRLH